MAEQDRYESHLGGKIDKMPNMPATSGAEQDRYGGWFGGNKADKTQDAASQTMPKASGAEQDRYGGWFGGNKADKAQADVERALPKASGAEQDRYGARFGGGTADMARQSIREHMPKASGAEQDRYEAHFGGDRLPSRADIDRFMPKASGAEQDHYEAYFGGDRLPSRADIERRLPQTSGAEQDRYGRWFGGDKLDNMPYRRQIHEAFQGSGAEQDRYNRWFGGDKIPSLDQIRRRVPRSSGAEQDRLGSHMSEAAGQNLPRRVTTTTLIGLFSDAVLPSFTLHAGLGAVAYGISRYTGRVEGKDWIWPAGQVANAWWSAIGTQVLYDGMSVPAAWAALSYKEKLLLGGVSAWGIRLFYRIVTRSVKRGKDDDRYDAMKTEPGFWNKAFFTVFLPEAVAQTLIALPFTLPFRATAASAEAAPFPEFAGLTQGLAVFLFTAGYALETLADSQLAAHAKTNSTGLNRDGVWSIVRHPNYLGDALVHLSFPVLLYSAGLLHPLAALGPIANYVYLRYIGGDKKTEAGQSARYAKENPLKSQELQAYKDEKNSFWPDVKEAGNKWLWIVAGAGAGGVVVEQLVFKYLT